MGVAIYQCDEKPVFCDGADIFSEIFLWVAVNLVVQIGSGKRPILIYFVFRDSQRGGCLFDGQTGEVAELDHFGHGFVFLRQISEGFIENQQVF